MGSLAVSTCSTSVFRTVCVSRTMSELGVNGVGDGKTCFVTVVVVVATTLFSMSSLPMSYN
jgi:hypothetical protein